ncbi:MAG: hypothetical protein IPM63_09045 [Acidobacteriota bacterium]|nr:MAG: hypothetical protein IPM63_09045 [Acidobacteriota bacterium]
MKQNRYKGAGDLIWLAGTKDQDRSDKLAVAVLDPELVGRININGQDIEFKVTKDQLPDENFVVGKGGHQVWKGDGLIADFNYVFTWLCEPDDEGCEVYHFKGNLKLEFKGEEGNFEVVGFGGS